MLLVAGRPAFVVVLSAAVPASAAGLRTVVPHTVGQHIAEHDYFSVELGSVYFFARWLGDCDCELDWHVALELLLVFAAVATLDCMPGGPFRSIGQSAFVWPATVE